MGVVPRLRLSIRQHLGQRLAFSQIAVSWDRLLDPSDLGVSFYLLMMVLTSQACCDNEVSGLWKGT